jgi:hypothetical protein
MTMLLRQHNELSEWDWTLDSKLWDIQRAAKAV